MVIRDVFKTRHFTVWSICLLFVVVSASIVFVGHVASGPSEPFVSVSFVRTNVFPAIAHVTESSRPFVSLSLVNTNVFPHAMKIEVTNKTSFSVDYWIVPEVLLSGKWEPVIGPITGPYQLAAHSQRYGFAFDAENNWRFQVSYARRPRTFEISLFKKLPWLEQHYPFHRRRFFTIYDPVIDVHGSSLSKQL